jgi:prephenate dehydrogenase
VTDRCIGIVGLGLVGGSLALALRRARPRWTLLGVDTDPATRAQALAASAVHEATPLADASLARCDAVVLAVPAPALVELIPVLAGRMREGAVLTDVGGSKAEPCRVGALQSRVVFVGGHPMAGTEFRGFGAADAALFAGATVALCPPAAGAAGAGTGIIAGAGIDDGRSAAAALVGEIWRAAGAGKLLEVSAEAHDRAVTYASHLPYLAAAAVVESLRSAGSAEELARELAAGGFRDTTRLAGDGTVGGAASLNAFVPAAARALAEALRSLAAQLEEDPAAARKRLADLAEERRAMKLPVRRPGP